MRERGGGAVPRFNLTTLSCLDNLVTNNNGNKNDNDVEIFYASGSWRNVIPYKMK
jgi:hypothetical protein